MDNFSGNSVSILSRGKGEHRVRPYGKSYLVGANFMFALIRLRFSIKILGPLKAICVGPLNCAKPDKLEPDPGID
jgi:hypothetical protein